MADQVITVELELSVCIFVECCSHETNIQNFTVGPQRMDFEQSVWSCL